MDILDAKTIDASEDVANALKKMAHGSERQLFVVEDGKLVGVVTLRSLMDARSPLKTKVGGLCFMPMRLERDFDPDTALEFMINTGLDALPILDGDELIGQVALDGILKNTKALGSVADHMTADPISITSDTQVSKARSIMRNYGIHRLIIADDEVHPDGIITASDIVRKVLIPVEKERRGDFAEKKQPMYSMPVGNFMTKNIISVSPRESANSALQLMVEKDLKALPVVEDGELVGIVTKRAIASTLLQKKGKGAWVRMSGADELDYFTVSLIHKLLRDYVKKLARKEDFEELNLAIKGEYEVKAGLISEGKRIRSTESRGWDPVAAVAEALRKLEKGAKQ